MKDQKLTIQEGAMRYGTYMGIFWSLKFVLFPSGMHMPLLLVLFFILTIAVPFVGYKMVRQYQERYIPEGMTFSQAFLFTNLLYVFAGLFTSVFHYIYFRFLDNGLIIGTYQSTIEEFMTVATEEMKASLDQLQQTLDLISSMTPLEITWQLLSQNIFNCMIIAVPTALFIAHRHKK